MASNRPPAPPVTRAAPAARPAPAAKTAPPPTARPDAVLAAFTGPIKRPRLALGYHVGLVLVAITMVILPLLYLGLVSLAGYGVYWHATHNFDLLNMRHYVRGAMKIQILLYFAPLIAGCVVVFFLLKPLLAPRPRPRQPVTLNRKEEPLLFSFLDKLCETLGAPRPWRVAVDTQINASAGLHLDMVKLVGSRLELTIGLPLASGLTTAQLAGVLAHEFGHFRQGSAMRLSQLVRRIDAWFARVVYLRDEWDEKLAEAREEEGWGQLVAHLAAGAVWLSRKVLHLLMLIGHGVSCYLMRQMELDADRYEIRLAGSDTFVATARRLRVLAASSEIALEEVGDAWAEGRLADDLPSLVAAKSQALPPAVKRAIENAATRERTRLFDTHPSDQDRIARARAENAPGVFRLEAPATVLFRDFPELARRATWDFYRQALGPAVKPEHLVKTAAHEQKVEEHRAGETALPRYSEGLASAARPFFPALSPPRARDAASARERLVAARTSLGTAIEPARTALATWSKAEDARRRAHVASTLVRAGVVFRAADLSLPSGDEAGIERARERAAALAEGAKPALAAAEAALSARWQAALDALAVPETAEKAKAAGAQVDQVPLLTAALAALASSHPRLLELREEASAAIGLAQRISGQKVDDRVGSEIGQRLRAVHAALENLQQALGRAVYPFDEKGREDATLASYVVREGTEAQGAGELLELGRAASTRWDTAYERVLGRLALVAESTEKVLAV